MRFDRRRCPQRGAEYGERVWQTLRPQLIPYQKKAGCLAAAGRIGEPRRWR